jgi:DNA-binding CsgD family transcriptional regulator
MSLFVGRQDELSVLEGALREAASGHFTVAVVLGAAGIGKTALARTFVDRVAHSPARADGRCPQVYWAEAAGGDDAPGAVPGGTAGAAPSGGAPASPWGRLARLLRAIDAGPPGSHAHTVAGGHGRPEGTPGAAAAAPSPPAIVVLDDAQLCDEQSTASLGGLSRMAPSRPVLFVVLARPLRRTGPGAVPCVPDGAYRVDLGGLAPLELAELSHTVLGEALSPAAAESLFEHTSGNPLYALSLLQTVRPAELEGSEGPWAPPEALASAVREQLAQCSPGALAVARCACVLGPSFSVADLTAAARSSDVGRSLDELVDAGLVRERPGTHGRWLEFADAATRATVYLGMSRQVRRSLHSAAALVMVGRATLQHKVAAFLAPDAELAAEAERYAREDAASGQLRRAQIEARTALRLSADRPERRPRLLLATQLALLAGERDAASALLEEGAGHPADVWSQCITGHALLLSSRVGAAQAALESAAAALAGGPPSGEPPGEPPDELARYLAALRCQIAAAQLDAGAVRSYGEQALAGWQRGTAGALALVPLVLGLSLTGNQREARSLVDGVAARTGSTGLDLLLARAAYSLWSGDLAGAATDLDLAFSKARNGTHLRVSEALLLSAELSRRTGRLSDAVEQADLALEMAQAAGQLSLMPALLSTCACARSASGDLAAAYDAAAGAEREAHLAGTALASLWAADAWSCVAHASDDLALLESSARDAAAQSRLREPGFLPLGPLLAEALARGAHPAEAEQALAAARRSGPARTVSARVHLARVEGLVAASRQDWPAAEAAFRRAATLATRSGLRLAEALAHLGWGRCALEAGQTLAAQRELARAAAQLSAMGATSYLAMATEAEAHLATPARLAPPLPAGLAPPLVTTTPAPARTTRPPSKGAPPLTRAEQAVVRLLASGLSNADIARRLVVSVKAVEYHLTHIYAKFGVSSRLELVSLNHALLDGTQAGAGAED